MNEFEKVFVPSINELLIPSLLEEFLEINNILSITTKK